MTFNSEEFVHHATILQFNTYSNADMNNKLTLNLNKHIIESAKEYAKNHKVSLSQLIENYISSLTKREEKDTKVSALVESLTGVIPNEEETDYRKDYHAYLNQKYS